MIIKNKIKSNILELCEEDDYSSWELYWSYNTLCRDIDVEKCNSMFIDCMNELINDGTIVSKIHHEKTGECTLTKYDSEKLNNDILNINNKKYYSLIYWFGIK